MSLKQKIDSPTLEDINSVVEQHKDLCDLAKRVIERKGVALAVLIRDKLGFRENTKH